MTHETYLVEAPNYHLAALVILSQHPLDVVLTALEGLYGCHLSHTGRTEHGMLMYLAYGGYEVSRAGSIAQTPAGHSISFGETVKEDSTFLHPGEAGETGVFHSVGQSAVDFIRDYQ